jgi:glucosyl-3-phosphoglycerate synthase
MRKDVAAWLARRSYRAEQFPASGLAAAKSGSRVSVVLPALNEERTVGDIITTIREDLVEAVALVDELVVVDSGSTDATIEVAAIAGARVVEARHVLPRLGHVPGKGEVLWKALHVTTGDVVVFVDSDLEAFSSSFVTGLLGPLLTDPDVGFVKATYDRPLATVDGIAPTGGGRVTELLARPLLNALWPQLSGFVQPLSGEYAGRRHLLERVPFVSGYGVETGLLIDLLRLAGLDALCQVDLGRRAHGHQSDQALGRMAGQILHTVLSRLPVELDPDPTLVQYLRDAAGHYEHVSWDVSVQERPPIVTVPAYRAARLPGAGAWSWG